jgi:hypothetical protein
VTQPRDPNAHPVGSRRRGELQDHVHRLGRVRSYDYEDAATLLTDFWNAVDAVLRERGVIHDDPESGHREL